MVKIKWSDFLNPGKKIAINCQTKEDAKEFLQMLDAKGCTSCGRDPFISGSFIDQATEDKVYRIGISGNLLYGFKSLYDQYDSRGYTIYRYSEVEFVDDDPEKLIKNPKTPPTEKATALDNIVKAMTEVRCNLEDDCDFCEVLTNAAAMKLLAESFEIVSRTEV